MQQGSRPPVYVRGADSFKVIEENFVEVDGQKLHPKCIKCACCRTVVGEKNEVLRGKSTSLINGEIFLLLTSPSVLRGLRRP